MKNSFCKGWIKLRDDIEVMSGPVGLKVEVANRSDQEWRSGESKAVLISYHWLDEAGNVVIKDGFQTRLATGGVAAGKSIMAVAEVNPPKEAGNYQLVLTLIRHGMYWFDDAEHFRTDTVKIRVEREVAGLTTAMARRGGDHIVIRPYEKGRRLAFMHIPKASGTAMRAFLEKAIKPKKYCHVLDRCLFAGKPDFTGTEIEEAHCYFGHASLGTLMKCCPDGQYLTVFREASSRILSRWLSWASFPDERRGPGIHWEHKQRKGLTETLLDPEVGCQFDNAALRMLVWPHPAVPDAGFIDAKDDEELAQLALDRLKSFDFVDVIENPDFERNLSDWFGGDVGYERANVTASMANERRVDLRREFTPKALEALEARSRLDRVLWTTVAAECLPGVDLERLTRDTLVTNMARYGSITSHQA